MLYETRLFLRMIVGWKPILYWLFGPKNQSFQNKSGKTQPMRTKFGTRGQVEGWQRSGNFGRDRPILAKNGGWDKSHGARVFCLVNHVTFLQLSNGWFLPNLVTKHRSVSRRGIRKNNVENFHFRGHLPQNLKSKIGQTGTSLRASYSSRDALQRYTSCLLHFVRTREFPRFCQLFCTTYGCGATGRQNCPIFGFWPIFPIQNP